MSKTRKLLALVLALVMCLGLFAGCTPSNGDATPTPPSQSQDPGPSQNPGQSQNPVVSQTPAKLPETKEGEFTYNDYANTLATNWNPHTWEQNDESAILDYLSEAFLDMTIDDSENGVYQFVYGMATEITDVTAQHQDDLTKFGAVLPEGKTADQITQNYVYEIKLNPECKWQDGTPITADDYIYSMKACLDPLMKNYRSNSYWSTEYAVAGAASYYNILTPEWYETTTYATAMAMDPSEVYIDVWDAWGAQGYTDSEGNECPQYLAINQSDVVYNNADGSDETTGKGVYDTYNAMGYIEGGKVPLYVHKVNAIQGVTTENYEDYYDQLVGVYKVDDYTIRYVYSLGMEEKMSLYHFANRHWLVNKDLYEASKDTSGALVTTTYNSSVETTMSYGPYKLESIQPDKQMVFVQNENWWGWQKTEDGRLVSFTNFNVDGEPRQQFQTTRIVIDVMDNDAAKQAFLKGEVCGWTPTGEDLLTYGNSDQLYQVDETYTMRLFFNTNVETLQEMDRSKGNTNSVVLSNKNFRKAMSLAMDRAEFVTATAGYKPACFLMNNLYFYDVFNDPKSSYRSSDPAMKAICDLYGVSYGEGTPYPTLQDAYQSINGYNLTEAKALFTQACDELVEAGLYKKGDPVNIKLAWTQGTLTSSHQNQGALINKFIAAATEGTGFGPVTFELVGEVKTPYDQVPAGEYAVGYGAWGGAPFTPFTMLQVYCDPDMYSLNELGCWDPTTETLTLTVNGQEETMTWQAWSNSMGGTGKFANADTQTKLQLLADLEREFLNLYYCFPMCTTTSCSMLAYKVGYYTENYNIMYGFGGMRLMHYNYNDAEWKDFVASQNGTLSYE